MLRNQTDPETLLPGSFVGQSEREPELTLMQAAADAEELLPPAMYNVRPESKQALSTGQEEKLLPAGMGQ